MSKQNNNSIKHPISQKHQPKSITKYLLHNNQSDAQALILPYDDLGANPRLSLKLYVSNLPLM